MRLYLQTPPTADGYPRFYHLFLQEDLLGGWMLVKESGQQGLSGKITKTHFADHEQAMAALVKARDAQTKRGYRVVFVKGDQGPA
ncbi:MAG: WGR domain-containing protein [Ectothiorhodospiraceae bacterium]|nr:WGR domain-containing protein [Ectothiorhodospiraceae bacterium]